MSTIIISAVSPSMRRSYTVKPLSPPHSHGLMMRCHTYCPSGDIFTSSRLVL